MGLSWLLFWLILLGFPSDPPITVERTFGNVPKDLVQLIHKYIKEDLYFPFHLADLLPDSFPSGSDLYRFFWNCIITTGYLGISLFAIFIWSKVLAVKPHTYQVNLQQISNKIKNFMDENAEIAQKISILEQKTSEFKKCIKETKREFNVLSDEANKFKDNIKTLNGSNEMLNQSIEITRVALIFKRNEEIKNQILMQQQIEGRKEHSELLEKIKYLENKQKDMEKAMTEKDNTIAALTNCIAQLNESYESEFEDKNLGVNEVLTDVNRKMEIPATQMMDVSQTKAAISAPEDDLEKLQFRLGSMTTTKCNLEEYLKQLEDECNALRSVKHAKEEECKTLSMKLEIFDEIYAQRKMSAEKKLEHEEHKQQKTQKELSAAEEKNSLAMEEVENYKKIIEEMEKKLQQAESSFKQEIALYEKKEHDNWIRIQDLERAMVEETRAAAYLRCRLEKNQNKKAQEKCGIKAPMLGRTDMQNPPCRGPGAAPVKNNNSRSSFPAKMMEEGKDNMAASGPPPFQGSPFMPYPMGGPPPPRMGYWWPPPPWWLHPRPPPPPFGPSF
ncbi:transport and Golgi organization protein 1 homolog [Dasypus novemcinctus]|uniref:transport and Golgi organization protein 1 homolog n=1 Tax=Dasypus novemcinctus TaxID=9361 RepID=UPI00265E088A|nr:transport and Golgi organization protein 1 homolog [Dasypus novemcinctus]XP_058142327.1 transport and Golgi organization protein 1 homolog isoform X1 [Dasypus novemcinctus]